MRIGMISEHASPLVALGGADAGGQNVYVGQVAKHLARLGHQVDVFTRRERPGGPQIVPWGEGIRVIQVPAGPPRPVRKEELLPYMGEFTEFLLAWCRQKRHVYDLFHAHFFMSALVAAEIKRVLHIPFVVTFHALGKVRRLHQGDADTFPAERLAIEARVVAEADVVIAECPQDEGDLVQLYEAPRERIRMVPCGFDPDEFWPMDKQKARAVLGIDPEERVILQLGRMVPRKGIETVIRALARLRRDHGLGARLLVVGGESRTPDPEKTPEIGRLMRIARDEHVSDLVTFVGSRYRSELRNFYCAADVFVTTPWYEPFGITPIEAMACGTPVIGSAVGGIKYTVREGETGFLVPAKDASALAERLALVFREPQRLEKMGRRAVHRARSLFTWRRVAGELARIYEDVAATATAPRLGNFAGPPSWSPRGAAILTKRLS